MAVFSQGLYADNIGLLIMATGKYIHFVPRLIESADQYFCPNHHVTYFVFTDGLLPPKENVICVPQKRLGWPYDTMMRYHVYLQHRDLWETQDYVFAVDSDMLFVDYVGEEILGERVATVHPGFVFSKRSSFPYETNRKSMAYISSQEGEKYFAGGFYGGSSREILHMLEVNTSRINDDLSRGMIAVWHDESHWNRYCIDYPPTVMLSPSYCYPESWNLPFPKKLVALDKNHEEIRKN